MLEFVRSILTGQFEASLCMFNDCLVQCPAAHWDQPIAKYPFWQVAYHSLCFFDLYLSPSEAAFEHNGMRRGPDGLHPNGWSEFNDEYPSRRFEQPELLTYTTICRRKMLDAITAETRESLELPSGFPWLPFSRGELHIYNLRHLQHHTGQLGASLRRMKTPHSPNPIWVKAGWR